MERFLKQLPLLILLATCLLAGIALYADNPIDAVPGETESESAANYRFTLPDLKGEIQDSEQWQGKLLIVNFWASWCAPCLEEMPRFITLQTAYADRGIQFVGIGIDQPEALAKVVDRLGVNYPVLQGDFDAMQVAKQFGNEYGVLPYTSILDPEGELFITIAGAVREGEMEQLIKKFLQSAAAKPSDSSSI
ncbi:MAG: TlpA disulfide reductase family protein [Gammaproteobacteria bacterium]